MMTQNRPKILYIVGEDRSGSTILARILGALPGFFAAGELMRIWSSLCHQTDQCSCGLPLTRCRIWSEVMDTGFGHNSDGIDPCRVFHWQSRKLRFYRIFEMVPVWGKPLAERWPESERLKEIYSVLYRSVSDVTGAGVIVDSSKFPTYGAMLSLLDFDTYFLHLVRDPRATAYSHSRRRTRPDRGDELPVHSPANSALRWIVRNTSSEVVRLTGKSFMRLRYKDFVRDADAAVRSVAHFVREPIHETPLSDGEHVTLGQGHLLHGNPDRFRAGEVRLREDLEWVSHMKRSDVATVNVLTSPLLRLYGYRFRDRRSYLQTFRDT